MADLATPSAADMATARVSTPTKDSKDKSVPAVKPERPDEEVYKTELAKAEKELKSAEERLVCSIYPPHSTGSTRGRECN